SAATGLYHCATPPAPPCSPAAAFSRPPPTPRPAPPAPPPPRPTASGAAPTAAAAPPAAGAARALGRPPRVRLGGRAGRGCVPDREWALACPLHAVRAAGIAPQAPPSGVLCVARRSSP